MLAGPTADTLLPVGPSEEHNTSGYVFGDIVLVPTVPYLSTAYVQMVAWDGRLWGTDLAGVPSDQFGRTDIATVVVTAPTQPQSPPLFTQPAVVPIPEPSVLALGVLGGAIFFWSLRARRRHRNPA